MRCYVKVKRRYAGIEMCRRRSATVILCGTGSNLMRFAHFGMYLGVLSAILRRGIAVYVRGEMRWSGGEVGLSRGGWQVSEVSNRELGQV